MSRTRERCTPSDNDSDTDTEEYSDGEGDDMSRFVVTGRTFKYAAGGYNEFVTEEDAEGWLQLVFCDLLTAQTTEFTCSPSSKKSVTMRCIKHPRYAHVPKHTLRVFVFLYTGGRAAGFNPDDSSFEDPLEEHSHKIAAERAFLRAHGGDYAATPFIWVEASAAFSLDGTTSHPSFTEVTRWYFVHLKAAEMRNVLAARIFADAHADCVCADSLGAVALHWPK